jgi:DNA processing protein
LLTLDDPGYPARLRQIYDPPVALYVRGDAAALTRPSLAIVGTRHPTPYRLGMAERLSCDLANRGLVIVSGLARGIDAAAHRGAITAKGCTVAIFGTGIDVMYPRENKKIAESMLKLGGARVTEFPVGAFAAPQNLPLRNRIISGLAVGVLVIEAGEYGGTRITARCALEQNREVFAVPGNVTSKGSWGPNTLIKPGVKLVATWEDVFEDLPADVRLTLAPAGASATESGVTASLIRRGGASSVRAPALCPAQARRVHAHRRAGGAPGAGDFRVRNLRGALRARAGGEDPPAPRQEFCQEFLGAFVRDGNTPKLTVSFIPC